MLCCIRRIDVRNNACKWMCLARQFIFNSSNNKTSKNDPNPVHARTRRATVKLITINGVKRAISIWECCCIKHECHSCCHVKFASNLVPTSDFFYLKSLKSWFLFMIQNEEHARMTKNYDALFSSCPILTMKMNSSYMQVHFVTI